MDSRCVLSEPINIEPEHLTALNQLSGISLLEAAHVVWQATLEMACLPTRARHHQDCEAIVAVGCQIRPLRDWILVEAVDHPDVTNDVARTLGCLAVKSTDQLTPRIAGAAAMLMVAESYPRDAIEAMLRLCPEDSLGQLVAEGFGARIPAGQVRSMLCEARPIVEQVLNDPAPMSGESVGSD